MEVITKTYIDDIYDLKDMCWSGALDRINEVIEYGIEDEFMEYLEEQFSYYEIEGKPLEDTDLNDFIWFECDDWIEENKPQEDEDE